MSTAFLGVQVVKVYSEDGASRSVEVAAGATARYVCEMLVQRAHALSDENWALVECHPYLALGEPCRGPVTPTGTRRVAPSRGPVTSPDPLFSALDPRAGPGGPRVRGGGAGCLAHWRRQPLRLPEELRQV